VNASCTYDKPDVRLAVCWVDTTTAESRPTVIDNASEALPADVAKPLVAAELSLERIVGVAAREGGNISRAVRSQTREIVREILTADPSIGTPNIGLAPDDQLILEWWSGRRKLTIYVGDEAADFIQVWGPDVDRDMADGALTSSQTLANLRKWLRGT
jgi:hypothetical protein